MDKNISANSIPKVDAEKFVFVQRSEAIHDKKLDTKPVGYFKGAFKRFCKNKGSVVAACVITALVLFAIIAPWCTPYTVSYSDNRFGSARPKSHLFQNTSFWDGCRKASVGEIPFMRYYAMGLETGHNAIKNQEYEVDTGLNEESGREEKLYTFRLDTYQLNGCIYKNMSDEEYQDIQRYQNETGIQVIYPTVRLRDRPGGGNAPDAGGDANYYFRTKTGPGGKTVIDYGPNGELVKVYAERRASAAATDEYQSLRIEGENGFEKSGQQYYYVYALIAGSGWECRVNYYEYYIYQHAKANDGIKEPFFLFGCDGQGRDILTCLASGARFSFLFAIAVAVVNMLVGALYGSVEGYYGGKLDLTMERISDILSAVPMMIVITLLKYHMGGASHILVLFLSFFLTGWIGMAHTTRMQFYRFKNQEYVLAARTLGAKDRRLMFKHIFPNAIGTLVTSCALIIPSMIYSETNLTYLGIINLATGNITSVGTLIAAGQQALSSAPHVALFPSLFLVLLMLSFNLFGNGLRDAFNPSLRGSEG